jgi:hypothetical protein
MATRAVKKGEWFWEHLVVAHGTSVVADPHG